jgi:hypothetical protein
MRPPRTDRMHELIGVVWSMSVCWAAIDIRKKNIRTHRTPTIANRRPKFVVLLAIFERHTVIGRDPIFLKQTWGTLVQPAVRSTVSEYRIYQTILESDDRIRGVPDHARACGSIHAARLTVPTIICTTSRFPEVQGVVLVRWPSYSSRVVVFGYVNTSIRQGIDK